MIFIYRLFLSVLVKGLKKLLLKLKGQTNYFIKYYPRESQGNYWKENWFVTFKDFSLYEGKAMKDSILQVPAETFDSATVYFSAIDGFTNLVAESTPLEVFNSSVH